MADVTLVSSQGQSTFAQLFRNTCSHESKARGSRRSSPAGLKTRAIKFLHFPCLADIKLLRFGAALLMIIISSLEWSLLRRAPRSSLRDW